MSIFPTPKDSFIAIRFLGLENKPMIAEFPAREWTSWKEFADWADEYLWSQDTLAFYLCDPRKNKCEDITGDLAEALLWHALRSGHINKYDPNWDNFPDWVREHPRFEAALPYAKEEFNTPEPEETERLRKSDLL